MTNSIIRVFPCRTSGTPSDALAFVGGPPLERPQADEVHISVTFTWDKATGERLQKAWAQYYPVVHLGGPAYDDPGNGFTPGFYIREGVTFTSRGCNNQCPWCLVPPREGRLRLLPIVPGNIVNDNNLLQCPREHIEHVFAMLRSQHAIQFTGGLQASLVTEWVAEEMRSLRIKQVFLAADTDAALRLLERAIKRLSFLGRQKLRCYVLLAFNGETMAQGEARLERVWEMGAMPFAILYQPPERLIEYSHEWRSLARAWHRGSIMKIVHHASGN